MNRQSIENLWEFDCLVAVETFWSVIFGTIIAAVERRFGNVTMCCVFKICVDFDER